jgi:hypothetical protein
VRKGKLNYFWKRFERYKKMRKIFTLCLILIVAASLNAATITSITATNAVTTFISNTLTMTGTNGLITYASINTPYNGTFSMTLNMTLDKSSGGVAGADFSGGSFEFKDTTQTLLKGSFAAFSLNETAPGMLTANCAFTADSGLYKPDFASGGHFMGFTFTLPYADFTNFSNFSGLSTMVATPVPEPMTLGILGLGALSILRKRKS